MGRVHRVLDRCRPPRRGDRRRRGVHQRVPPGELSELAAIELDEIVHRFGATSALDGLSLRVPRGSFVSLVGPSGCGKSTLLRVLAGLLEPTSGSARVDGVSTIGNPGLVAFMPQRDLLLPWRTALDNACIGADVGGADRGAIRERARSLFARFGLDGFENAWPAQLSGGMRQRVALLRTHLIGSDVLLLDEPFGALDAITRRELHEWLQQLWLTGDSAQATTALLVTHDVEEALFLSDRVHVLSTRPGRIVDTVDMTAPRPRDTTMLADAEFVAAKARLLRSLDRHR